MCGPNQTRQNVLSRRLSKSSVTRPPYWISPNMYCTVVQLTPCDGEREDHGPRRGTSWSTTWNETVTGHDGEHHGPRRGTGPSRATTGNIMVDDGEWDRHGPRWGTSWSTTGNGTITGHDGEHHGRRRGMGPSRATTGNIMVHNEEP